MTIECYQICTRIIISIFFFFLRNENLNKNSTINVLKILFIIRNLPAVKSILRLEVFWRDPKV